MNEKELSKNCFYFEMFMERAYGKYEPIIPGYHFLVMKNLIVAEKAQVISVHTIAHFEKQLVEIKKSIKKALDHYMDKPNVPANIIDQLKHCKEQVTWAVSSEELMKIVLNAIDITAALSIKMNF